MKFNELILDVIANISIIFGRNLIIQERNLGIESVISK